jgi:hypothetical protein
MPAARPLWRCPRCGQRFVSRNLPHSCRIASVAAHFAGRPPALRRAFDALLAACRAHGPVRVNVTASRIAIQSRIRFAGILRPGRGYLVASCLLTRPIRHPRFARVEYIPPYYFLHRFRLAAADEVDATVRAWLAEAHAVGDQRHLDDPDWKRVRRPPAWVAVPREVREAVARGEDPSRVRGPRAARRRKRGPAGSGPRS